MSFPLFWSDRGLNGLVLPYLGGGPVIGICPLPCNFACGVGRFGRPGWAEDPRVMPLLWPAGSGTAANLEHLLKTILNLNFETFWKKHTAAGESFFVARLHFFEIPPLTTPPVHCRVGDPNQKRTQPGKRKGGGIHRLLPGGGAAPKLPLPCDFVW